MVWGVRHFIGFIQLAAEDVNCAAGENSWKERPSMSLSIRSQKPRFKIWQFTIGCIVGIAVIFEYVHVSSWYKIRVLLEEHLFVLVWQRDEISAFLDPTLSYNAAGQLVSVQAGVKATSIFLPRHLQNTMFQKFPEFSRFDVDFGPWRVCFNLLLNQEKHRPGAPTFKTYKRETTPTWSAVQESGVMAFSTQSLRTLQAFLLKAGSA